MTIAVTTLLRPNVFRSLVAMLLPCLLCAAPSGAAPKEVHSNGLGGGRWSEAATWHGGSVPDPEDRVVITASDKVVYDGGAGGRPDCSGLYIDPDGLLTFRLDERHHQLIVAGAVETYGAIRADATRDPQARASLVLAAEDDAERVLYLRRGGSLLWYGAEDAPSGPNLVLQSATNRPSGRIEGQGDVMFDLQHAEVEGLSIRLSDIDNTGYRPRQRLNVIGSRFTRGSEISLARCDTAAIKQNSFGATNMPVNATAVLLNQCTLTACLDNRFAGYAIAIDARNDVDASLQGNRIFGVATAGLALRSSRNAMVKRNLLVDCATGLLADKSTGVVEGLRLERVKVGAMLAHSTLQMTDVHWVDNPEEARPLELRESTVTLLNCNLAADEIILVGRRPPGNLWVQSMSYLVVRVTGKRPDRAVVQVSTAKVSGGAPQGAADLNVRNSPARLSPQGWTPLPRTLRPIILRSWQIGNDKKVRDAPFYDLTILPLADDAGKAPKALHRQVVEPSDSWFRAEPDAPVATLEVNIP